MAFDCMPDLEELAQEAAIWPWLDSDCMGDPTDCSPSFYDPDYFDDEESNND